MSPENTFSPALVVAGQLPITSWRKFNQLLTQVRASNTNEDLMEVETRDRWIAMMQQFIDASSGRTLLHMAVDASMTRTVHRLVKHVKVPVDRADKRGKTALMYAARLGVVAIVSILLRDGRANATRTDKVKFR
jgi:hypothetical protein